MQSFSIGKLAKAARVSIDTIRFYERSGLLPQPARRPSGFREYSQMDLEQLRFIRTARALGFSLQDIAELLALDDVAEVSNVRRVVEEKLAVIDRRIQLLERWRNSLAELTRIPSDRVGKRRSILNAFESAAADIDVLDTNLPQSSMREVHRED